MCSQAVAKINLMNLTEPEGEIFGQTRLFFSYCDISFFYCFIYSLLEVFFNVFLTIVFSIFIILKRKYYVDNHAKGVVLLSNQPLCYFSCREV